jgi:hypothetical protein
MVMAYQTIWHHISEDSFFIDTTVRTSNLTWKEGWEIYMYYFCGLFNDAISF